MSYEILYEGESEVQIVPRDWIRYVVTSASDQVDSNTSHEILSTVDENQESVFLNEPCVSDYQPKPKSKYQRGSVKQKVVGALEGDEIVSLTVYEILNCIGDMHDRIRLASPEYCDGSCSEGIAEDCVSSHKKQAVYYYQLASEVASSSGKMPLAMKYNNKAEALM